MAGFWNINIQIVNDEKFFKKSVDKMRRKWYYN